MDKRPKRLRHEQRADDERLVMSIVEAARLLDLSRNAAYAAASRGDLPTLRIGHRLLVPRRALERLLDSAAEAGDARDGGSG